MQVKTERSLLNIGNHPRPVVSVAIAPKTASGHLAVGMALGLVFGFIIGSVVALSLGDKSLTLAQQLWSRLFGLSDDGERVHFELLLQ